MKRENEKTGIIISIAGSGLLALSAVVMALITGSQAILLDGLYTFIILIMSYISLRVINLLDKPETRTRPFGYMALEPFLNLMKTIIILTLLIVFLITNIQEIASGGRIIALDLTIIYIILCLIIYIIEILLLKKYRKGINSNILELEIKNWYIDTWITVGIAISLVAAILFFNLGYKKILPYIDPVIVLLLVIVSLPVPLKYLLLEAKRLLLLSHENNIEKESREQLKNLIEKYRLCNMQIWALKSGRTLYIFIYTSIQNQNLSLNYLDKIRKEIFTELSKLYPRFWADIIFTDINPQETTSKELIHSELEKTQNEQ